MENCLSFCFCFCIPALWLVGAGQHPPPCLTTALPPFLHVTLLWGSVAKLKTDFVYLAACLLKCSLASWPASPHTHTHTNSLSTPFRRKERSDLIFPSCTLLLHSLRFHFIILLLFQSSPRNGEKDSSDLFPKTRHFPKDLVGIKVYFFYLFANVWLCSFFLWIRIAASLWRRSAQWGILFGNAEIGERHGDRSADMVQRAASRRWVPESPGCCKRACRHVSGAFSAKSQRAHWCSASPCSIVPAWDGLQRQPCATMCSVNTHTYTLAANTPPRFTLCSFAISTLQLHI